MGKDTKYLTLALIALLGIATLIVLYPRQKKVRSSENFHTETEIEHQNNTKSTELYADNSSVTTTSTDADPIKDAYNALSEGKLKEIEKPTTTKTKPTIAKPAPATPDAYEELTKSKRATEKLTAKGGTAKTVEKPVEKINTNKLSGFLVVTNQFGSKENAQTEVAKLKAKGYDNANSLSIDNKVFMAYAGWMNNREDAVKLLNQLKKKGFKPIIKDLN